MFKLIRYTAFLAVAAFVCVALASAPGAHAQGKSESAIGKTEKGDKGRSAAAREMAGEKGEGAHKGMSKDDDDDDMKAKKEKKAKKSKKEKGEKAAKAKKKK